MLQSATIQFLNDIRLHNSKEWMEEHRQAYVAAASDFEQFITAVIAGLAKQEPAMADLTAKKCIFRFHRDIRFSKDKSPYKTNFGAAFSAGGKKTSDAGYYFHLEPGGSFIGGGMWMPEAVQLKNIRQEIDYDLKGFEQMLHRPDFKKLFPKIDGERLKKAPQGFEPDNPAIDYLRLKSFTVGLPVGDKLLIDKKLLTTTLATFKTMQPFIQFLNRAVS